MDQLLQQYRQARLAQQPVIGIPGIPSATPAPQVDHSSGVGHFLTGMLGGYGASALATALLPPQLRAASMLARAIPHVASLAGFMGAPAVIDATMPKLHEGIDHMSPALGAGAALGLPLAIAAVRRQPTIPRSTVIPPAAAWQNRSNPWTTATHMRSPGFQAGFQAAPPTVEIMPTGLASMRRPGPGVFEGTIRPPHPIVPGMPEAPIRGLLPGPAPVRPTVEVVRPSPAPVPVATEVVVKSAKSPATAKSAGASKPAMNLGKREPVKSAAPVPAPQGMRYSDIHNHVRAAGGNAEHGLANFKAFTEKHGFAAPTEQETRYAHEFAAKLKTSPASQNRVKPHAMTEAQSEAHADEAAIAKAAKKAAAQPTAEAPPEVVAPKKKEPESVKPTELPVAKEPEPAQAKPPVRTAGDEFKGPTRELFDALATDMEKKIAKGGNIADQAAAVRETMAGENKKMRVALNRHLKEIAPEVHAHMENARAEKSGKPLVKESPVQPAPTLADDVATVRKAIENGDIARKGSLQSFRELRKEAGLPKERFDDAVHELAKTGEYSLSRHDYATSLTPAEREQLVPTRSPKDTANENHYVGMARRPVEVKPEPKEQSNAAGQVGKQGVGGEQHPHGDGGGQAAAPGDRNKFGGAAPSAGKEGPAKNQEAAQASAAAERGDNGLKAAFKSPISGKVTTGKTHAEAFNDSDVPTIDAIPEKQFLESEGFVDKNGKFLTRDEALKLHGGSNVEDLALRKAIEKQGGFDANSANDIDAIRNSIASQHGVANSPSHKQIREFMDKMRNEAPVWGPPKVAETKPEPKAAEAGAFKPPEYKRETPSGEHGEALKKQKWERVAELREQIRPLEKLYREKSDQASHTPRSHHKKRAALEKEASEAQEKIAPLAEEERRLGREANLISIENYLQASPTEEHHLRNMVDLHDFKRQEQQAKIDNSRKAREIGYKGVEEISKVSRHHQEKSDEYALKLMDKLKARMPADKLNPQEINAAVKDAYSGFAGAAHEDLGRIVDKAVERRIAGRSEHAKNQIDQFKNLDAQDRQAFEEQAQKAAATGGADWHDKLDEIVNRAKGYEEKAVAKNEAARKVKAELDAKQAAIDAVNAYKEERESNRLAMTEPKYFESAKERSAVLKGKKEKEKTTGTVDLDAERILEREHIGPEWHIETSMKKNDKGELKKVTRLIHTTSGLSVVDANAQNSRQLVQMFHDAGVDLSKYKTNEEIPKEVAQKAGRVVRAWEYENLSSLNEDEQKAMLGKVLPKPSGFKADITLDAADLGYGQEKSHRIKAADANEKIKKLADEVPEFSYNPVFRVSEDKKLVFHDGHEFKFHPEAFNLHPEELKAGQTVGINLADLGIAQNTEHDVVQQIFKDQGWNVTKSGGGFSVKPPGGGSAVDLKQVREHQWNTAGTKGPDARAQAILDKIKWRQEGQKEAPKIEQLAAKPEPEPAKIEHLESTAPAEKPEPKIAQLAAKPEAKVSARAKKSKVEKLEAAIPEKIQNPYGDTPTGKAYMAAKAKHGNAIVLLKKGHSFESFGSDAQHLAKALGINLSTLDRTSKSPTHMAGFGVDKIDEYRKQLEAAGHKVHIVEG